MAKLLTRFGDESSDQGRWLKFSEGEKLGPDGKPVQENGRPILETVEFRIRRLPSGKAREINYMIFGRTAAPKAADKDKFLRQALAFASYALLDSRNADFEAGDAAAAETFTNLLGRKVEVGEMVRMDGHWTEDAKRYVLEDYTTLMGWITERSGKLEAEGRDDEDTLLGN